MDKLILLVTTILAYLLMRAITGIYITDVILDTVAALFGVFAGAAKKEAMKSAREFSRMSSAQRKGSTRYKYYAFVNDILVSLRIRQAGITVEGVTVVTLIASVVIASLTMLVMKGIFMFVALTAIIFVAIMAVLYLISRVGAQERKRQVYASIDILCSVMSDGVMNAVETSVHMMPPMVRGAFKQFIVNVNHLNVSLEDAIRILNDEIGPSFDTFCSNAIVFERDRAPGMITLFSYIINDNARESLRDIKIQRVANAVNRDFAACMLLMIGTLTYTITAYQTVAEFYLTTFGNLMIIVYALSALITFIMTQYILAKPYSFTEEDVI